MRDLLTPGSTVSDNVGGLSLSLSPLALTEPHSISMFGGLPMLSTEKYVLHISYS